MNLIFASRRQRALPLARLSAKARAPDRAMRVAVLRARKARRPWKAFPGSKTLTATAAALVRAIPIPHEVSEWFRNEKLLTAAAKRSWRKAARNPVTVAIALALLGDRRHFRDQRQGEDAGFSRLRRLRGNC